MFSLMYSCRFYFYNYSKTYVKRPLSKDRKLVFKTNYHLTQVKSIAECSKGSILQYFRPSLSYHLSLRSLFCLFLSGRLKQVLLYRISPMNLFYQKACRYSLAISFNFVQNMILSILKKPGNMPTKCSDAQPQVEYEKQLP